MFLDVPIIGSPHNTPSIFDQSFWIEDTDYMTEKYLKRKTGAANQYIHKIKSFLNNEISPSISPREFILSHAGYKRYADDAYKLANKYLKK